MALDVSITIRGDSEVIAKVNRLGGSLLDLKRAMEVIGRGAADYYATTGITDQGRPFGQPWRELSQGYKMWKEINYPGRPLMERGGPGSEDLKGSFTFEATRNSARIFNSASYFKYHQSSDVRQKLPRRQMMGINVPIKKLVSEAIQLDVDAKIRSIM